MCGAWSEIDRAWHTHLPRRDSAADRRAGPVRCAPLSVIDALGRNAAAANIAHESVEKLNAIGDAAYRAIEVCRRAGVRLGLGTDLLGHTFHTLQGGEIELRGRVDKPIDVLRSATSVNAQLLQQPDTPGQIRAGAHADILVLDFDPLKDLVQFREPSKIPLVMKGGVLVRNTL